MDHPDSLEDEALQSCGAGQKASETLRECELASLMLAALNVRESRGAPMLAASLCVLTAVMTVNGVSLQAFLRSQTSQHTLIIL